MKLAKFKNRDTTIPVGKILCVGRNYAAHAEEMGNEVPKFPIIFLKPSSVLKYSGEKIEYPSYSNELHHEVELVLLIGETIKNGDFNSAQKSIRGYGIGLDMTLRDLQRELKEKGHPWTLSKCFDGSAVISDFISVDEYNLQGNESIKLWVNGEIRQNSVLDRMIFSSIKIVEYISSKMTLEEGDLVFTGTPAGVGKVSVGDIVTAEIANVGKLSAEIV